MKPGGGWSAFARSVPDRQFVTFSRSIDGFSRIRGQWSHAHVPKRVVAGDAGHELVVARDQRRITAVCRVSNGARRHSRESSPENPGMARGNARGSCAPTGVPSALVTAWSGQARPDDRGRGGEVAALLRLTALSLVCPRVPTSAL